jgi:hypothetical protein
MYIPDKNGPRQGMEQCSKREIDDPVDEAQLMG